MDNRKVGIKNRIILVIIAALLLGCLSACGKKTYIEKDTPGYSFTNIDEATPSDGD